MDSPEYGQSEEASAPSQTPNDNEGWKTALLFAVSILTVLLCIGLLFILPSFGTGRKEKESRLCDNLQMLRSAIQSFQFDTGVYPAALADLVAPNEAALTIRVKPGTYEGPYLAPYNGINGTGIPKNPFTNLTETMISDHWKYNPKTGKVTVPDSQAGMTRVDDGTPFKDL